MPRKIVKQPGAYIDQLETTVPTLTAVNMSVPVFIGYPSADFDDTGLLHQPISIISMQEYEQHFGTPPIKALDLDVVKRVDASGTVLGVDVELINPEVDPVPREDEILYYALQHFFSNGGERCWVYALGGNDSLDTPAPYKQAINALEAAEDMALMVLPGVSCLTDSNAQASVAVAALESSRSTRNRFCILDVPGALPGGAHENVDHIGEYRELIAPEHPEALPFGAAYWPYLCTTLPWNIDDSSTYIKTYKELEVRAGTPQPVESETALTQAVSTKGSGVPLSNTLVCDQELAIYSAAKSFTQTLHITLPSSAAVAGVLAKTDRNQGIWHTPSNIDLAMVQSPAVPSTSAMGDALVNDPATGKSINAIRAFTDRGARIWGGRTLAGNDNDYRYVSVRRMTLMVEMTVREALADIASEGNNANTWVLVRTMTENFLQTLWRAGALQGSTSNQAYFVKAGLGVTMTQDDIDRGDLKVEIGLAAVRPAEFILLRLTQGMTTQLSS